MWIVSNNVLLIVMAADPVGHDDLHTHPHTDTRTRTRAHAHEVQSNLLSGNLNNVSHGAAKLVPGFFL